MNSTPRWTPLPDARETASRLGISEEAVEITRTSEVIDLHLDTFIPVRAGYDPYRRHKLGLLGGRFFGHLDLPRVLEAGLTAGMWSITTNPFRLASSRWKTFQRNLARLRRLIEGTDGRFRIARNYREFEAARADGAHACLVAIQGGNALEAAPNGIESVADDMVTRITLVHLTNSVYGATSSPLALHRRKKGLTAAGRAFVEQLNAKRVFVDLAHINEAGFWDAVEVHDRSQPLIVTHTGVSGVKKIWRNLDDRQVKAIADTGGTVGVIFAEQFLRAEKGPRTSEMVIDHLEHIIRVAGEDFASLGSDYDGAIVPPKDLRDGVAYPRIVQGMLDRSWSVDRIRKILGTNFLRTFRALRP